MKELDFRNGIRVNPDTVGLPNLDSLEIQSQFKKIFDKIHLHPDVEDLSVKSNWLRTQELNRLADILSSCPELNDLDLTYNLFTLDSIPALKKIIDEHPKLEIIRLDFNRLTDEFIEALIEGNSEEFNQKLKSIKISLSNNNFLTVKSIDDTRDKLTTRSRLTMLVGNQIGDDLDTEYREKIWAQDAQASSLGQSAPSPVQAAVSEMAKATFAPFTPLKNSNTSSPSGKPNSPGNQKGFEESKESIPNQQNPVNSSPR